MNDDVPQLLIDIANDQICDASEAAARAWGMSPGQLRKRHIGDLFHPMSQVMLAAWGRSGDGTSLSYPVNIIGTDGSAEGSRPSRWMAELTRAAGSSRIDCRLHPYPADDQGSEVRRLNWALDAYRRSSTALIRAKSTSEMAERACAAIVEYNGYALAVIALADPPPSREMRAVAIKGDAQAYFTGITLSWDPEQVSGQGPTGYAMRSGRPYVMYDSHLDPVFTPWRERAERFGIRSSVTVPFRAGDGQVGAVIVYARTPGSFTDREMEVFQQLGNEFAFALSVLADQARLDAARRAQLVAEAAARQRQAELARVSRVLMLGEFTSSIAHELTQPLAAIVTNSETALRWLAATPPNPEGVRQALQRTIRDAGRAQDVIQRTRALIAKEEPKLAPCDLNLLIEEVVFMLSEDLFRSGIHVEIDLDPRRPRAQANSVQIQQVLINLIINARDAMRSVTDRERRLSVTTTCGDDGWATVKVVDNGEGIDPAVRDRLFDHLFSTKQDGLGLGLPISRSIIESHGGRIGAEPGIENGLVLSFTLPRCKDAGA